MSMTRERAAEWFETHMPTGRVKPVQKQAYLMALSALRPVSRERVEKVWRGEWTEETYTTQSGRGRVIHSIKNTCSDCGKTNGRTKTNFCPACGAPMTDEAVEIVMERMEALKDGDLE